MPTHLFDGRFDKILVADRYPTYGQYDITAICQLFKSLLYTLDGVGGVQLHDGVCAQLLDHALEHGGVGVIDLSFLQGSARVHQLITGTQNTDSGHGIDIKVGAALGSQQGHMATVESYPLRDDGLIAGHILTSESHIGPLLGQAIDSYLSLMLGAVFLHDNGIGALRDQTTGKSPDGLAGGQRHGFITGIYMILDGHGLIQAYVAVANGITIHGTIICRRNIYVGMHDLGTNTAQGLPHRYTFGTNGHGGSLNQSILCGIKI